MKNLQLKSSVFTITLIFLTMFSLISCSGKHRNESQSRSDISVNKDSVKAEKLYNKALLIYSRILDPSTEQDSVELRKAVHYLDSALKIVPDNWQYLNFRGDLNLLLGKLNEALSDYKYVYNTSDSTNNEFSFILGLLSYYLKEPDYTKYFNNAMRVYKKKMESKSLDDLQRFNYESSYIYSLYFIDSAASIKQYVPFREKCMKKAPFMFDFDLRKSSKDDLVGYFVFHDTFNGTPPDKKKH
jgi:tetratricopeptide (TPR) repeat protein